MKKYIFIFICLILLITGCSNKEIEVTCTKINEYEKQKVENKIIMKFNDKQILNKLTNIILETDMDKETYDIKKEEYSKENRDPEYENSKITFYDKERKVTTETIEKYNPKESEKKKYKASVYIKKYEEMAYKCKIKGSTRKELGLK